MITHSSMTYNETGAVLRLIDAMKRAKEKQRGFTVFLGAGCSMTSSQNNLSTKQILINCLKDHLDSNYAVPSSWEDLYRDFVNHIWNPFGQRDRQEMLSTYFMGLTPHEGYKNLRRLVEQRYITDIITTNFDMLIDDAFNGLSYCLKVGTLPEQRINGGSNVHLIKVHGDIEKGQLKFSPEELDALPEDTQNAIRELSKKTCFFCGYSGQDRGLMKSLDKTHEHSVFWVSPNKPIEDVLYENRYVYDWIRARRSESNFIFGKDFGTFDNLMICLARALIDDTPILSMLSPWDNNTISQTIRLNKKVYSIFTELLKCSAQLHSDYEWKCQYPFYAKDYGTALRAYLYYYSNSDSLPSSLLQLPENEVEALLMGIAIEILARASGLLVSPYEYAQAVKHLFENRSNLYAPDESFWMALLDVLSAVETKSGITANENMYDVRLKLNSQGRLTISVREPKLSCVVETISLLSICGLFIPTCESGPDIDRVSRSKLLLQERSGSFNISHEKLIFKMENISRQELADIYHSFFVGQTGFSLDASGKINGPRIEILAELVEKELDLPADTISSCIEKMIRKTTGDFLRLRSAFEIDSDQYVSDPLNDEIEKFIVSSKTGLFVTGPSGSGKTKAIQQFIKGNKSFSLRIAAISPKSCSFDNLIGIDAFGENFLAGRTFLDASIIQEIGTLLAIKKQLLVFIVDGLNEINGGLKEYAKHYRSIIDFLHLLHDQEAKNIKVITTCRDLAFIDCCEATGCYPSPDICFCYYEDGHAKPYYQISPLPQERQIAFAKIYFADEDSRQRFITDIKNNKYIRQTFNQPYLMAIAGKYYSTTKSEGSKIVLQDIFAFYIEQMLNRLGSRAMAATAREIIQIYFRSLISEGYANRKITQFMLINEMSDLDRRDLISYIIKQLRDINIFTCAESTGYLRFSHDRIEEHFLCDYLMTCSDESDAVTRTVAIAQQDPIFFTGLQLYFARCMTPQCCDSILKQIGCWYGINSEQIPCLLAGSLVNLTEEEIIQIFKISYESYDFHNFVSLIFTGLKLLIQRTEFAYPEHLFACFGKLCAVFPSLAGYRVQLYYIASRYYLLQRNNFTESERLCDLASKFSACDKNLEQLVSFQKAVLLKQRAKLDEAVARLGEVYLYFETERQWDNAAECVLEWGSALRQQTKFEQALVVYEQIDDALLDEYPSLQAKLYRKKGTIYKNLLQKMLNDEEVSPDASEERIEQAVQNYRKAMTAYEQAKRCMKKSNDMTEFIKIVSEQAEAAMKISGLLPEQIHRAEMYLGENERLLADFPIPDGKIVYMRLAAKFKEISGQWQIALSILREAGHYAVSGSHLYRAFEVDYQIGRLVEKNKHKASLEVCEEGLSALERAVSFDLPPENQYIISCRHAKELLSLYVNEKFSNHISA